MAALGHDEISDSHSCEHEVRLLGCCAVQPDSLDDEGSKDL
ncbi:hypothetical protein L798_01950 [Zootermopsis nevadensis]|uniref:Uncharacterized protein n=1 Tax=Zootermopsis nevadensis TaxID=136037 RepID=A0A067QHU5_ZOONE|nr:hypothetical protein L798_01950 [Zootermopsis nevadensis]